MRFSNRQLDEVSCLVWFHPSKVRKPNKEAIKAYFDLAERGIRSQRPYKGLQTLLQGKTFRDAQVKAMKEDLRDGLLYWHELFESDVPEYVQRFYSKAFSKEDEKASMLHIMSLVLKGA